MLTGEICGVPVEIIDVCQEAMSNSIGNRTNVFGYGTRIKVVLSSSLVIAINAAEESFLMFRSKQLPELSGHYVYCGSIHGRLMSFVFVDPLPIVDINRPR